MACDKLTNKFADELSQEEISRFEKISAVIKKEENSWTDIDSLKVTFQRVERANNMLLCPNCGFKLIFLMPDGKNLHCTKCEKYYLNNDGSVGNETTSPYDKTDVLY